MLETQGAARITAGLPALTPDRRDRTFTVEKSRFLTNQALRDEYIGNQVCLAPDGNRDVGNWLQQCGRPLLTSEFMRLVKRLNPNVGSEPAIQDPSKHVLYVEESFRNDAMGWERRKRYLCGMEAQIMPEFSVRLWKWDKMPDPSGLPQWVDVKKPTGEMRGWRTVLVRLMKERLVSPAGVEQLFKIAVGRSSMYWQAQTS